MKIKKRIVFDRESDPHLVNFLLKNGVPFEAGDPTVLEINDDHPAWPEIEAYVTQNDLLCLSETSFTKMELANADWLRIRSQWRFGYPQPEDDFNYENITYTRRDYCPICSSGLVQTNPFRIKKAPKWGARHFAELNWVGDELFVDDTAKEILTLEGITGISFLEVVNKKGVEAFSNIHQIQVGGILDLGLQANRASVREMALCPECGIPKFLLSGIGMLSFRKEVFDNQPDFVKSGEIFGSGHYASRIILVRQKVYQTIVKNGLDRGLVFEPVELV